MQLRPVLLLALTALLSGCADPGDPIPNDPLQRLASEATAQAAGATPPRIVRVQEDISLALGDCSEVGSTSACFLNVGDPSAGGESGNIVHIPIPDVVGTVANGTATFTWSAQSPLNEHLELRLTLLDCDGADCSTHTILVAQEGSSPFTLDIGALSVPEGLTLGLTVTRAQAVDGVRVSTFQDVHVEGALTLA